MISKDLFAAHVERALESYCHSAELATSPLMPPVVPGSAAESTRVQSLREQLRQAIEFLKPMATVPYDRPEWLAYRLMWTHYVQARGRIETCQELGISETSYYRHRQKALAAVVNYLWHGYRAAQADPSGAAPEATPSERAREEAVRLAHVSSRHAVDLDELTAGICATILPLLNEQGVKLHTQIPDRLPTTYGDPGLLRQIVLNLLTEALPLARQRLRLSIVARQHDTVWCIEGVDRPGLALDELRRLPGLTISEGLLDAYGGRLEVVPGEAGGFAFRFSLPSGKPVDVLIVDDDEDTTRLYQVYCDGLDYALRVASDRAQLDQHLDRAVPDLILLDVLMPQTDGWRILQRLKADPATAAIPIVICSVLSQPRLALALGASAVLQKPIEREALVRTMRAVLAREGTAA